MAGWRAQFEDALRVLARVSMAMDEAGHRPPILVGGAAVEIYTQGQIATGDFDLICGRQDLLEEVFARFGFERPSGPGKSTRGWIHPNLGMGFEVVSDTLLGGLADRAMVRVLELGEDGAVAIIAPEDIIADRMGSTRLAARRRCWDRPALSTRFAKVWTRPIWNDGFQKKQQAVMAFKTLQTKREPLTLEALAQSIARRRKEVPDIRVPRNHGTRRTGSKQALLDAIARTGADW